MSPHALFDHTGDIGFEVRAPTAEALHEEAARALFGVIVEDLATVRVAERVPIRVDGAVDREDLALEESGHGAHASMPPLVSSAPSVKCGLSLLSYMDSAEPIAMCMSRYL